MIAKVFLTAVAQPHPQYLGDLFLFGLGQWVVQRQGLFALVPTGSIVVGIPVAARYPNAAADLFD